MWNTEPTRSVPDAQRPHDKVPRGGCRVPAADECGQRRGCGLRPASAESVYGRWTRTHEPQTNGSRNPRFGHLNPGENVARCALRHFGEVLYELHCFSPLAAVGHTCGD